ncbi:MAG: hypothetical protein ABEJ60_02150 [Halodesulfurarchaeum sp.]
MSNQTPEPDAADPADTHSHLEDVESGAGCTEIWEALSERRAAEGGVADD